MKTLIFMASPNEKGNTADMVKVFINNIHGEYKIINAYNMKIRPCVDCKFCNTEELQCDIEDDMVKIYEDVLGADNIVIVSPVYFGGFPAPMKAILDRFQIFWGYKYYQDKKYSFDKKKGILLSNCGIGLEQMFIGMEKSFNYLMKSLDGVVVGQVFSKGTDKTRFIDNHSAVTKVIEFAKVL